MRRLTLIAVLLGALSAFAHPPVSVVVDRRGNVFYSDLEQVWRIAPNGTKSVAVPHVHTHELFLDAQDNLYGEHLWYEGERTNEWGHFVWRRAADGRVTLVKPRTKGFLRNYSFVRDRTGAMYWSDKGVVYRNTTPIARGFRDIRWMHATPAGTLYFIDSGDLVQIRNGRTRVIARGLASTSAMRFQVSLRHAIMGVWTDAAENIYLADYAHGAVKRVTQDGRVTTVASSTWPWSPTGGVFVTPREMWVLEASVTSSVRVRKVRLP